MASHAAAPTLVAKLGLIVADAQFVTSSGGCSSTLGLRLSKVGASLRLGGSGGERGAARGRARQEVHQLVRPVSLRASWRSENLQFVEHFAHREQHLEISCEGALDVTAAPIDVAVLTDMARYFGSALGDPASSPPPGDGAAGSAFGDAPRSPRSLDAAAAAAAASPPPSPATIAAPASASHFDSYVVTFNEGPLGIRLHRRRNGSIIVASVGHVSSASMRMAGGGSGNGSGGGCTV